MKQVSTRVNPYFVDFEIVRVEEIRLFSGILGIEDLFFFNSRHLCPWLLFCLCLFVVCVFMPNKMMAITSNLSLSVILHCLNGGK